MIQQSLLKPTRKEHGGILSAGTRRSRRSLSTKLPLHMTLRSDFAYGNRSLLKHQTLINHIGKKFSRRFGVRIYRQVICGNHIHLQLRGTSREGLQNFFRVFAGLIAQQILATAPITELERARVVRALRGGAPVVTKNRVQKPSFHSQPQPYDLKPCRKNQRKFWALLTYSRVLTWGREFATVSNYLLQNTLEALHLVAYQPRKAGKHNSA